MCEYDEKLENAKGCSKEKKKREAKREEIVR